MKAKTILIEETMTAKDLLVSLKLKPELYLVAQEGKNVSLTETVKQGSEVRVIPAVKGG